MMLRLMLWLMLAIASCGACNTKPAEEAKPPTAGTSPAKLERYACPMHPEVTDTTASDCPKCGMKLVLVKAEDGGTGK